jgi:hypothetical protein
MATATQSNNDAGRSLGTWGAVFGLIFGTGLGSLRFGLSDQPDSFSLGNLAFLVSYTMPFVVALGAIRLGRSTMRAAVWFGCGALGILSAFTAFSGVSLILVPPGVLLLAAAYQAVTASDFQPEWPILPVSVWLMAVGILAFVSLFRTEDPRSWSSGNTGHSVSDVISDAEGLMSLGIWAVGLAGLVSMLWVWGSFARD